MKIAWDWSPNPDVHTAVQEAAAPLEQVILASADEVVVHKMPMVHYPLEHLEHLAWAEPGSRRWDLYLAASLVYGETERIRRNVSVALVRTALCLETGKLARAAADIVTRIPYADSFDLPLSGRSGVARMVEQVVFDLSEGLLTSLAWELDQMTGHAVPVPVWQRTGTPLRTVVSALREYGHEASTFGLSPEVVDWLEGSEPEGGLPE